MRTYVALGLAVAALLLWNGGWDSPPSPPPVLTLAWLAVLVLVAVDAVRPGWARQLKEKWSWLGRPVLGTLAALLAAAMALVTLSYTPGGVSLSLSAAAFVWDAARRGELAAGPFDVRLLWRGWKRAILIGTVLGAIALQLPWENWEYYAPGYTTRERIDSYTVRETRNPAFHAQGERDAYALGKAGVPLTLLLATLVWGAWRGSRAAGAGAPDQTGAASEGDALPEWYAYVPLGLAALLVLNAVSNLDPNQSPFGGFRTWAAGPTFMLIGLLPYYAGAIVLARRRPAPAHAPAATRAPAAAA
jgi:hypothetical protein